ncbi:MAG: efflux RND transporter permease subunit [Candidatus Zixiibacteriota bacterium]
MILADTAIKRPVFTVMVIAALMVLGVFSYNRMAVDLFPDVDFPFVVVVTVYPGAGPEAVESEITKRIEDQINTISGLKHLQSSSREGVSQVVAQFELGEDPADKALEVREKISAILADLPDDAEAPIIQRYDPDSDPIMSLVVSGSRPLKELTTLTKDVIKKRLESVPGVGAVSLIGGAEREIQIGLDADRLKAFAVSVEEVAGAVRMANVEFPAGRIDRGRSELTLRTLGKYSDWRDFGRLVVAHRQGDPIRLSDLAVVSDSVREQRNLSRFNGREAVSLDIVRQSGANTVRVADEVVRRIGELKGELPGDVDITVAVDNSVFIRDAVHDVMVNIYYGGLLAVLVIFVFLINWRTTLISALAIPTSIISSFTLMSLLGFTINFMSLLGLSIAVGLLIDDAIVVIENIYRNFHGGADNRTAAARGTSEIGLAVLATTFTIVVVFVPVAFMGGIVGRFFYQFGMTVAVSVLVSLFVAFTLTPMLFSRLVTHPEEHESARRGRWFGERWLNTFDRGFNHGFDWVKRRYRGVLAWALDHRAATMAIAVVGFLASFGLVPLIGTEFLPQQDQAQVFVQFEAAPGTSLRETAALTAQVEERIRPLPEVRNIYTAIGSGQRGVNEGVTTVLLSPKSERQRGALEILSDIRRRTRDLPGLYLSLSLEPQGEHSRPISLSVQGEDLRILRRIAGAVEDSTRSVPGARDVRNSLVGSRPEAQIIVERDRASELGLSMAGITSALRLLVEGDDITTYKEGNEEYKVRLRLAGADRADAWAVENLMIHSERDVPGQEHFFVPLKQVARLDQRGGPTEIRRYDRRREVLISGNIAADVFAGDVRDVALTKVRNIPTPPGYSIRATGEAEIQEESFGHIFTALFLAVIFIYFVLASQYESFTDPLAIMLSLPMALVGAFGGLFLFGSAISIISLIGVVLLMGLVTKNAILLVDFVKQARARGESRRDAILAAGPIRLRPILMTTLATIFGVLPLALGFGPGAELRAPMARAVIGGLISSTALTLLVVPVVYTLLDDLMTRLLRRKR